MKLFNYRSWSWEVIVLLAIMLWFIATIACGFTVSVMTATGNALSDFNVLIGFIVFLGINTIVTRILVRGGKTQKTDFNKNRHFNQGGNQNR